MCDLLQGASLSCQPNRTATCAMVGAFNHSTISPNSLTVGSSGSLSAGT